jgi:site-specific recombinase XerD
VLVRYFRRPSRIELLRSSTGGHVLEGFANELSQGRYQWVAARKHIRAAEHFLHWVAHRKLSLTSVEDRCAQRFLDHLKRCRCRRQHPPLKPHRQKYSVDLWFDDLRRVGIVPTPTFLDAPEPARRVGIRDRAMLHLCFTGGLRVSELVGVRVIDVRLQPEPNILIHGKGRRERCIPLWNETASAMRAWLSVRGGRYGSRTVSRCPRRMYGSCRFEYILRKHVRAAEKRCASLSSKQVSPHVLRHTCAMTILQATKDLRKVSLWLGHSSVQTTEATPALTRP